MRRRHSQLGFAGSIHFITTVTEVRGSVFVESSECKKILESFEVFRNKFELVCCGYVLMPDHLHAVLVQPNDGSHVSDAIGGFKRATSLKCKPARYPDTPLWRDNFDDVPVPGVEAAKTKLRYMLANPVRAGLVERPEEYEWSSAPEYYGGKSGIVTVTILSQ
ncbi:transposase [candidate division KSB1 bacterium]|nr:transposase [candidate division KSB1 bacterium]